MTHRIGQKQRALRVVAAVAAAVVTAALFNLVISASEPQHSQLIARSKADVGRRLATAPSDAAQNKHADARKATMR
jgi:hypothetical protein